MRCGRRLSHGPALLELTALSQSPEGWPPDRVRQTEDVGRAPLCSPRATVLPFSAAGLSIIAPRDLWDPRDYELRFYPLGLTTSSVEEANLEGLHAIRSPGWEFRVLKEVATRAGGPQGLGK